MRLWHEQVENLHRIITIPPKKLHDNLSLHMEDTNNTHGNSRHHQKSQNETGEIGS